MSCFTSVRFVLTLVTLDISLVVFFALIVIAFLPAVTLLALVSFLFLLPTKWYVNDVPIYTFLPFIYLYARTPYL